MFWTNTGDETSFKNIKILEPGKYLTWSDNNTVIKRHYNFPNLNNAFKSNENIDIYESLNKINNQIHGEVNSKILLV